MSTEANKALMRHIMAAINTRQLDALDGHPDLWETRQVIPMLHTIFSEWRTTVLVQVAEDDLVFSYCAMTARQVGQFAGVPATGAVFPIEVWSLDRIEDGKIVNHNSASTWYDTVRALQVRGFEAWPPRAAATVLQPPAPLSDRTRVLANKRLINDVLAALARGDERIAAQHDGLGRLVDEYRALRRAFPDLHYTPVRQLAEGDLVAARATLSGTHTEALYGLKPTGVAITWDWFSLARVVDGSIVAHDGTADWNAALDQLGIFTNPTQTPTLP